jgi:CHAT domain-containing protein/tetratricopeptide (TPR) repeat protein
MQRRGVILLLTLSFGCRLIQVEPPRQLYDRAMALFRQGNRDAAWELAERGLRRARSPDDRWRFYLLKASVLLARGQAAEAIQLLERKEKPPQDPEVAVRRWALLSRALRERGRGAEAVQALERALKLAEGSGSRLLLSLTEQLHGIVLHPKDPKQAAQCLRRALDAARRAGDAYQEAATLVTLGWSRMRLGRYGEAIPWLEQALAISVPAGYAPLTATARHNLGVCYNALGDWERALESLRQAEAIYSKIQDHAGLAGLLGDLGNTYYFRGEPQNAVACYRRGLALARRLDDPAMAARWLSNLAMMAIEAGDLESAERFNQEAVELRMRIGDAGNLVWPLLNAARIAAARGRFAEAEARYSEVIARAEKLDVPQALLEARARLGSLHAQTGAYQLLHQEFGQLAADVARLRRRLSRLEWKFTFQASIIPFYEEYVDLLVRQGEIARAWEVIESCRAPVLAERAAPGAGARPSPTGAPRSAGMQEASAVFSYWLAPKRSFLFVRTGNRVAWFALPPEATVRRLVEAYSNALLAVEDPRENRNAIGRRLYEILIAPGRKLIPPGANVLVVPDGALHELNFETLLTADDPPRYWIEEATVAVAPAVSVLSPAEPVRARGLLVLGDPEPPSAEFARLPDAAAEIAGIEKHFPDVPKKVITGREANPGAYHDSAPQRYALIHFAAHAEANRESPLDSAVILSRYGDAYRLYAREVLAQPLRAGLVTISACRSAGARNYSGEGLVGFAWAFLAAGARNVIAGLWDVNDRSTAALISELYGRLAAGESPARALRSAKLTLLAHPVYRRPYYWAPFQIFTRGGAFSSAGVRP